MKNILISACFLTIVAMILSSNTVSAQENDETITVKIVKSENGQVTVIDTTVTGQPSFDVEAFITSLGITDLPSEDDPATGKKLRTIEKRIIMCDSGIVKCNIDSLLFSGDSVHIGLCLGDDDLKWISEEGNSKGPKKIIIKKDGKKCDVETDTKDVCVKVVVVKKDNAGTEEKKVIIENGSGKDKLSNIEDLKFFPNPGDGKFELSFKAKSRDDVAISVKDPSGKIIYKEVIKNFEGDFNKHLDISEKAKGVYFLTVQSGKEKMVKKVVVE